ncbi:MAG: hypothetical protein JW776_15265 [Candidatus Lokiarchaeota archaeon]|nr:hypothetical protein [Candidatus Lokiarchaeota archaeon]
MLETCKFILSLDIGGANTKTSFLCLDLSEYKSQSEPLNLDHYGNILNFSSSLFYSTQYFPFWERKRQDFMKVLKILQSNTEKKLLNHVSQQYPSICSLKLVNTEKFYQRTNGIFRKTKKELANAISVSYDIAVTITAELSDAFSTKQEGIKLICEQLQEVFNPNFIHVINVNAEFISVKEALEDYLSVSASNWIAPSLVFGERERLGMLLDMGTTTTDIIPIKDGKPVPIGKNDVDRMLNYELFYTGILRPPIASIVRHVPFRNSLCPISFEEFAIMADVYTVLGMITEREYSCDTADGRGKSIEECFARLARIICGDINLIQQHEIEEMAQYIYTSQKEMVQEAIRRSINHFIRRFLIPVSKIRFNVTGLGAKILLIPALRELNIHENQIFFKSLSEQEHVLSTAICLGIVFLKQIVQHELLSDQVS